MNRLNPLFLLLPFALACGEKEPIDSGLSDDTATDDTATDDTAEALVAPMTLVMRDVFSSDPMPGTTLVANGETFTADAEGVVDFTLLAGTSHTFVSSAEGYLDAYAHVVIEDYGLDGSEYMLSEQTIAALSGALSLTIDPAKAFVHVLVSDIRSSPFETLPGTTLDLTVDYGIALVPDDSSPYKISPGNTALEDVRSSFYFANVDPGPLSLSITPVDGLSCEWGLGGTALDAWQPEVVAGAFNNLHVYCE